MDTTNVEKKDIVVSRTLNASIENAWNAWTDPELVMQWWAPDHFTSPSAKIDFREGGKSVVCMHSPADFGDQDMYSSWEYTKIVPGQSIDFIHNLCDEQGNAIDPVTIGMPADFPKDMHMQITFKDVGDGQTEMTVRQFDWKVGQMRDMGVAGLNQSLDKMVKIFAS